MFWCCRTVLLLLTLTCHYSFYLIPPSSSHHFPFVTCCLCIFSFNPSSSVYLTGDVLCGSTPLTGWVCGQIMGKLVGGPHQNLRPLREPIERKCLWTFFSTRIMWVIVNTLTTLSKSEVDETQALHAVLFK